MAECLPAQMMQFAPEKFLAQDPHNAQNTTDEAFEVELQRALQASAEAHRQIEQDRAQAHKRLTQALDLFGAQIHPCKADGNCQFRALSVALYGHEDCHGAVRERVVQQLKLAPSDYAEFVHEPYSHYLERMARDGEWGDHVTLQAASDALNSRVCVLSDVPGASNTLVYPKQLRSTEGLVQQPLWSLQEPLCITFLTEWHYDAAFITRS